MPPLTVATEPSPRTAVNPISWLINTLTTSFGREFQRNRSLLQIPQWLMRSRIVNVIIKFIDQRVYTDVQGS